MSTYNIVLNGELTKIILNYHQILNIVPRWDIEGRELASLRRYPNERQYSPISV